jgi:hypothetical protein
MKINYLFVLLISGVIMLAGCGKPNEAESVPDNSIGTGGYKIVKKYPTYGDAQDVVKKGNYLYIAQGEGGMLILDVSSPEDPQEVSVVSEGARGYSTKLVLYDTMAYIAAGSFGVTVVDIADPYNPHVSVSNTSSIKPAKNLHVYGEYLLAALSEVGVKIVNIEYPSQPDPRTLIEPSGYAMAVKTTSDSLYAMIACGEMGLSMHHISDWGQGYGGVNGFPVVAWCDTPGYAEDLVLMEDKKLALMACGTAGLQIINYADTNNVHLVAGFDGGGYAKEVKVQNDRVYIAAELSGLQIIDISNPGDPYFVGEVDTEFALGFDLDEDYIYLADEDEGLIIISIPK